MDSECQAPLAICSYDKRHHELTGYWVCNLHNRVTNHKIQEGSHKPCLEVDPNPCKACGKILGTATNREDVWSDE